ncbi:MAG: hypothetical protein AAGL98_00175 [Planctomycetota bacterium]
MRRKILQNPARQARQAHRQRLALGRALHQVRQAASWWREAPLKRARHAMGRKGVPKMLRKHERLLRRTFGRVALCG